MYRHKKISLVIPAYNEEKLIRPTLENLPELFDRVYVVDDCSTDKMTEVVKEIALKDPKITLISHPHNMGVGQGIITGYLQSNQDEHDIAVVCGGDFQMPLNETPKLLDPLIDEDVDYSKGNRFMNSGNAFDIMPATRFWGNTLLSLMTKIASGNYGVFDVVDGFTAITHKAIQQMDWNKAWKGYGYPMDFVIRISSCGFNIKDVPRTAVYLPGERQSQIKGFNYMMKVTPMIWKAFIDRLVRQYIFADFHPLVFLYFFGFLCLGLGSAGGALLGLDKLFLSGTWVTGSRSILVSLFMLTGLLSTVAAMGMDLQNYQYRQIMSKLNLRDFGKDKNI